MAKKGVVPPICGCSDRSSYVRALYKCKKCGCICNHCHKSCKKNDHKVRKLKPKELGAPSDWIRYYGSPL